jgi:putative hydrolase of the HAD superfamily
MIKHISFDLWLTLISSDPSFKGKKAELIADIVHPEGMNVGQIEILMREQDKIFDRYNEIYQTKIPAKDMYLQLLRKMNVKNAAVNIAENLMNRSNELLMSYMPRLLNDNIPQMLDRLQSDGITLSISSNTGFVEGKILRIILKRLNVLQYFSFLIFSDEVQTSKPSAKFFQHIYGQLQIPKTCILHIGDNRKTDYQGALNFGFKALLLKKSNYSIDDIKAAL